MEKDKNEEIKEIVKKYPFHYQIKIKSNPDLLKFIEAKTPLLNDAFYKLSTKIYWVLNDIHEFPRCLACNKPFTKNIVITFGYPKFCSNKCLANHISVKNKKKKTCFERYGHEFSTQSEISKQKCRKTKLEKYGSETFVNPEKAKKTCLERYGCENIFQNESTKEKIKKTNLERYGFASPIQNYEIQKRSKMRYFYDNNHFDSSPEIALYIYLKDNHIDFEYQPDVSFEYLNKDYKLHYYFPDFRIEDKFYEIKGDHFFDKENKMINPYDRSQDIFYESKHQCMLSNNIIILRSKDYQKYLNYIRNKYGKDYLKQFKNK